MKVQIIAIRKDNGNHYNPHEAISHYGWQSASDTGVTERTRMVAWLKKPANSAFVGTTPCEVRNNGRIEFLQTVANGVPTDNLLQLPPC
jgi:hypothetical protein